MLSVLVLVHVAETEPRARTVETQVDYGCTRIRIRKHVLPKYAKHTRNLSWRLVREMQLLRGTIIHLSSLALVKLSAGSPHPPPGPVSQLNRLFSTPNAGTNLDKSDGAVYFLHLEARNGGEGNSRLVLPTSWKL